MNHSDFPPCPRQRSRRAVCQIHAAEIVCELLHSVDLLADRFSFVEFFHGLLQTHPIFPTSSRPVYSNAAFQILGYVVEALGGKDFAKVLEKDLIKPLNLTHTFYDTPSSSLGVIPNSQGKYWWDFDIGEEAP